MSPKTGARMASEAVCVKMVPSAMAEGLTGGRSGKIEEIALAGFFQIVDEDCVCVSMCM